MASWIKVQVTLPESPKIFRLARLLGVGRMEALGYAVRWFCWLDSYCANGSTELRPDEVDTLVGKRGITRAFCKLEWAAVDADGHVLVLDFDKHNGESSKKRAENQARVAAFRERQAGKDSCNTKGVTLALPEKDIDIYNNEGVGKAVLNSAAAVEPAPTPDVNDEGFRRWLSGLASAHPSASKSLYLAPDVLKAAKAAYLRFPDAVAHAELLGAYFKDGRLAEHGFYAPRGQRKFFVDLEDVVAHAERWRKWAGWKPKNAPKNAPKGGGVVASTQSAQKRAEGGKERQLEGMATDEEREAFFRELRG